MTDYPYEGDLSAVFEAVAVPRIVDEVVADVWAQLTAIFPWMPAKPAVDEILDPLDDLYLAMRGSA